MERTLLSLASFLVLICAPYGAGAETPAYGDPLPAPTLRLKTESCNAANGPGSPLSYHSRVFEGRLFKSIGEAVDNDTLPTEGYFLEAESAGADPFDTGGPYELVLSRTGSRQWEKEYFYEESDHGPSYDVPVVVNEEVEKFIRYFQSRGRGFFARWLERSSGYLPMVKGLLKKSGLPEDLAYLALIESGFNPVAKSRAKAVGIWQFMSWTGKYYGLRVDWWIDERRDPEKATLAAADYLKNLYGRFGSWYLAAAGYNGGEGRVVKALKKYGTKDFWELAGRRRPLKKETKNYIPKYLAAMIIAKDPEEYGFYGLNYIEPLSYDKVKVGQATDLKVLAKAAGTTVKELKTLNPELKRWFTPPNYPDYELKIPAGSAELFTETMATVPPPDRLRFHSHRVKKGEALWNIARKYGTSIGAIMYLNNLKSARLIRAGSKLVVPVREKKARAKKTTAPVPEKGMYTVKKGDTLWAISIRFGVAVDSVLKWNGLNESDPIMPGQKLQLKEARLNKKTKTTLQ